MDFDWKYIKEIKWDNLSRISSYPLPCMPIILCHSFQSPIFRDMYLVVLLDLICVLNEHIYMFKCCGFVWVITWHHLDRYVSSHVSISHINLFCVKETNPNFSCMIMVLQNSLRTTIILQGRTSVIKCNAGLIIYC